VSLDPGYAVEHAALVSAHARPLRRPQRVVQAEQDHGIEPLRLELRIQGRRVTITTDKPRSTSLETARQNAIIAAARTDARLRALVAATPTRPPERPTPDWSYQDGTSTRGAQYARDMSAWHRLYVCRTDAPGRPR
jgi:hypothetical protein